VAIKIALYYVAIVPMSALYALAWKQEIQNISMIFMFYALKFAKRVPRSAENMLHIKKAVLRVQKLVNNVLRFAQCLKMGRIFTI
jgi:hypothetical protein